MRKAFSTIGIILLACLIIATYYDLPIDQALFRPDNGLSYFFEYFAAIVEGTVIMIGSGLVFWTISFSETKQVVMVISGLVYVLWSLVGIYWIQQYFEWWGIAYGVLAVIVIAYLVRKIPVHLAQRYRLAGIGIVLTTFFAMMVVEGVKPIFGRVRFRSMQEDFDLFSRWYQINGDKYLSVVPEMDEIKSFPSGHSMWAGSTLSLTFLATVHPKWQAHEKTVFLGLICYAVILMFSRMMQGAHFLSDVTMGFGVAFIFFVFFRYVVVQRSLDKLTIENKK
ncbi:MAG: phosphatase PAP2 family protein [Tetragenococcus sp.]|nr:phosphatase PAP2 family protein [Tetragenococcus sp.]